MFDIFENINIEFKEIILKKMKNDKTFNNYIKNCNKLNINLFDKNNIYDLDKILQNLEESKIYNFKNLKNILNDEYIEKNKLELIINKYYKKIDMLDNLKKYTQLKYNFGLIEIIEFDKNLFLLSEEDNTKRKIYLVGNVNNEIIEEYSNC